MTDSPTELEEGGGWAKLRRRKVVQWSLGYTAAAWAVVEAFGFAADSFGWSPLAKQLAMLSFAAGLPIVVVLAWYHGERGEQRVRASEVAILGTLLVAIGVAMWRYYGALEAPAGQIAATLPDGRVSMVVLPLRNLSEDPEQEYFSDGLTEELIAQLGRLQPKQLGVIARTSAMRYKGSDKPIAEIARELGVGYVLEGSARREGQRVRIALELIEAGSQTQLWADTFERELSGILAVQNEVAEQVASALALTLMPAQHERLAAAPAINPEAYDSYLKGLYHWYKLTPAGLDTAERYFELTLATDPNYARAEVGLALVWTGRVQMGLVAPSAGQPKSRAATQRALELDDGLAEAHHMAALLYTWADWNWAAAEPEFKRAIEINPSFADAHAFYAQYLIIMYRPDEALARARRAIALDPFNQLFHALYGIVLLSVHEYDAAIAEFEGVLAVEPTNLIAIPNLMSSYHHKRQYEQARELLERYAAASRYPELISLLATTAPDADYVETMRSSAGTLASRSRKTYVLPIDVAQLFAFAGDRDSCMEWLERAYELRDQNLPYLGNPDWDSLRGDPRFVRLQRRMNLPVE